MSNPISAAGWNIAVNVLKAVYQQIRPWLKEQAAKTDTPLDGWVLDLVDNLLGIQQQKEG